MKLDGQLASVHDHAVAAAKRHGHGRVERRHVVAGLVAFDPDAFRRHFPGADLESLERSLQPSGFDFASPADTPEVQSMFEQAAASGGLEVLYRELADLVPQATLSTGEARSWSTVRTA